MSDCSVIIPAYNRRSTLGRALASVLAQADPPHEVIVVDDASSDDTAGAAATFSDRRIRVIRHERRLGAAAARNTGARAARARWLAFLDSDDEWLPQKLARQIATVSDPSCRASASIAGYVIVDNRNGRETVFAPPATVVVDDLALGCPYSPGSTLIVSADTFAAVGEFDAALTRLEDWDWLIRCAQSYPLVGVPAILAKIHKSANPTSQSVASSTARLADKHGAYFRRRSWCTCQKFRSTLLVEQAASMHYEGKTLQSVGLTLQALGTWPLRGTAFYVVLWRRALGRMRSS
ncbi:MAG: glycosyltransferase [Acidobacteriota bacterium]|nr:glycosyltransferase [Acidobacteriota bacterium]